MEETEVLSDVAWFCVRTQPKHEHIAAASLVRSLGVEVFNPRLQIDRATRRGRVRVVESVFPCYLFVRCSLEACVDEIRYVNGVSSLVHFGNGIPIIPDAIIADLRQSFETEEPVMASDNILPGAEVVVAEGAFLGFSGVVVRMLPAKQRVQVLLDFLGRATLTEVDRLSIKMENASVAGMIPSMAASPRPSTPPR